MSGRSVWMTPDLMRAAAHLIDDEYGYVGYQLAVSGWHPNSGVIFDVTCSADGSWFRVVADAHGNAARLCDHRAPHQSVGNCPQKADMERGHGTGGYLCEQHHAETALAASR